MYCTGVGCSGEVVRFLSFFLCTWTSFREGLSGNSRFSLLLMLLKLC